MSNEELETEAFMLGFEAGKSGDGYRTCPYSAVDPLLRRWVLGYRSGEKERLYQARRESINAAVAK